MTDNQLASLVLCLILSMIFLVTGKLHQKYSPIDINFLYGYRSKRSMKNKILWDEANKLSSKIMMINSVVLLIVGIVVSLFVSGIISIFLIIGLMFVLLIAMIVKVETKLKSMESKD